MSAIGSSIPPESPAKPQPTQSGQSPSTAASQRSVKAEEFRKMIEVEVLKVIRDLAEKGETPRERIQEMANKTLMLVHPGMTLEQLFNNAVKLDDEFSELAPVVVIVMRMYEEQYEKKALTAVSLMVKNRQYDQAQDLIKKVLLFKIK